MYLTIMVHFQLTLIAKTTTKFGAELLRLQLEKVQYEPKYEEH